MFLTIMYFLFIRIDNSISKVQNSHFDIESKAIPQSKTKIEATETMKNTIK